MNSTANDVAIYALCDPDGTIRYIGQTAGDPLLRLRSHLYEAGNTKRHNARTQWLADLIERGEKPSFRVLHTTEVAKADDLERRTIAFYEPTGNLVNTKHTQIFKRVLRAAMRSAYGNRDLELDWRQMVRLPKDWGVRVERLASERALSLGAMLRLLIREGLDKIEHERDRADDEREGR